jgi:hypothetical protein
MSELELVDEFARDGSLSDLTIDQLIHSHQLRVALYDLLSERPLRDLAIEILKKFILLRRTDNMTLGYQLLSYAACVLACHGKVEDCLLVWEAKQCDFDAFCALDIQLMMFAGVEETLTFLSAARPEAAEEALEYIESCKEAGDFEELAEYFIWAKKFYVYHNWA